MIIWVRSFGHVPVFDEASLVLVLVCSANGFICMSMQIPLPVLVSNGVSGVKAYLAASDAYLESTKHHRRMLFKFPDIHAECPICHDAACAHWKGYYTRSMQDPELCRIGPVVIRYGRCRRFKIEFSFLPDFLVPRRRLSLPTIAALKEAMRSQTSTQAAIDAVVSPWSEAHYIPVSTAHSALRHLEWIVKSRYNISALPRRLHSHVLKPDGIGSALISAILKVLDTLISPAFWRQNGWST